MNVNKNGNVFLFFLIIFLASIQMLIPQSLFSDMKETVGLKENEKIYVKKIIIKGNKITRTDLIKNMITIDEKEFYPIETIIDEINKSRNNILSTELFSDVFFNDILDDNGNLELIVEVTEKGYLNLSPAGFIYLYKKNPHFHSILKLQDFNFTGNKSRIETSIYVYDSTGVDFSYSSSSLKPFKVNISTSYLKSPHYSYDSYSVLSGASYELLKKLYMGANLEFGKSGNYYLGFETPVRIFQNDKNMKSNLTLYFLPWFVFNRFDKAGYLLRIESVLTREIILQIENLFYGDVALSGGVIPERRKITSRARGYDPFDYSGNFRFSVTDELTMPFIFNYDIKLGLFLDVDVIGNNLSRDELEFLLGGGITLRWYHSILNPLRIDLSFGKGIMLSFDERF